MIIALIFIIHKFDFKEEKEQKIDLDPGLYKFECWGAEGEGGYHWDKIGINVQPKRISIGGKGAYTKGIISITTKTTFYIYVGEKGHRPEKYPWDVGYSDIADGGFNGGGKNGHDIGELGSEKGSYESGTGGGATDIRITDKKISSRIMVAAGGSGGPGAV